MYMKCPEQANPETQKVDQCLPRTGEGGKDGNIVGVTRFLWGVIKMV